MGDCKPDNEAVPVLARTTSHPTARVAVIGCGKIGSELDEAQPDGPVLTHAHAWQQEGCELVALADPRPQRLAAAGRLRGVSALYSDFHQLFARESLDVASICTPTSLRLPVVRAALQAGVRTLFLEKPVASTLEEANAIVELTEEAGAVVAVNYLRRWDPAVISLARALRTGAIGRIERIIGLYGKGIVNNGSHAIDLCRFLVGEPLSVRALHRVPDDMPDADPTLDVVMTFASGNRPVMVHLIACDYRTAPLFELDFVCNGGRIRFCDGGLTIAHQHVEDDPSVMGYKRLSDPQSEPTGLGEALAVAAGEISGLAMGGMGVPRCTLSDGVAALRVSMAAVDSFASGGAIDLTPAGEQT